MSVKCDFIFACFGVLTSAPVCQAVLFNCCDGGSGVDVWAVVSVNWLLTDVERIKNVSCVQDIKKCQKQIKEIVILVLRVH